MRLTILLLACNLLVVIGAPAQTQKPAAEGDAQIRATLEHLYAAKAVLSDAVSASSSSGGTFGACTKTMMTTITAKRTSLFEFS